MAYNPAFVHFVFESLSKVSIERVLCEPLRDGDEPFLSMDVKHGFDSIQARSPFRADNKTGSFIVTPSKNIWWDFAAGYGGDKIIFYACIKKKQASEGSEDKEPVVITPELIEEIRKHEYVDYAMLLARDLGIITDRECRKYSKVKLPPKAQTAYRVRYETKAVEPKNKIVAPPDVVAATYSALLKMWPLTKAHEKHLLRERMLPRERLADYMSIPSSSNAFQPLLVTEILEGAAQSLYGLSVKELVAKRDPGQMERMNKLQKRVNYFLPYVPGLYYDEAAKELKYVNMPGIGQIYRDDKGRPVGVHVQRENGKPKYMWWSSNSKQGKPNIKGGASSGSPAGVLYPSQGAELASIAITEGKYKAEHIAAAGNICIYLAGVSSWSEAIPYVEKLRGKRKDIFIMFDADALHNTAVAGHVIKMGKRLTEMGLNPFMILWPLDKGKGFDDLRIKQGYSEYARYLQYKSVPAFEKTLKATLPEVLARFGAKTEDALTDEQKPEFHRIFQEEMEKRLGIK